METTGSMIPVPQKLRRLRQVMAGLRNQIDETKNRHREIAKELQRVEHNLASLEAEPNPYMDQEKSELGRAIKAAKAEAERLRSLRDDAGRELDELQTDYRPTLRTVRSLEDYLGMGEDEQFMPPGNRVKSGSDNFQPAGEQS